MKLRVYNNTLDPNIWNEDKTIKPEIREHLLKIAEDFYNSTDLDGEIHNILFLGSSANYNWSPTSDMDLHVVIDIAEEKINEEYARKFMDGLSFKWNTEHDIEIKGHPIEVYLQDLREPNSDAKLSRPGAAIYSLFDGKWVQEPNHEKIDFDVEKIRKKFFTIKEKVKKLVETSDIEKLKELMTSIRKYRDTGLGHGGEFCTENLVFKALRKSGLLEKIKDTVNTIYDKQVSLPKNGNMQPKTDTTPMNENIDSSLFIGWIDRDTFRVQGIPVKPHDETETHYNYLLGLPFDWKDKPDNELIRWRYRKDLNTVFWWSFSLPTVDEKEYVSKWIEDNLKISNPIHKIISAAQGYKDNDEFNQSHGV